MTSTTRDRMSDPTEILRNIAELLVVAKRRGDRQQEAYLNDIIDQIEAIWAGQGRKP